MIDLGDKLITLRSQQEFEEILKEGREQGYRWIGSKCLKPIQVEFPYMLITDKEDKTMTLHPVVSSCRTNCEASDLLREKEMTAREFVEWACKCFKGCNTRSCQSCVLSCFNTKFGHEFCSLGYWPGNEDELLELAKAGRITIDKKAKEELNMKESLNALIKDKSNDEILRCVKYLIERMKEEE